MSSIYTFFGFKDGRLITVVQTLDADILKNNIIKEFKCDTIIIGPDNVEKQIVDWWKQHEQ